MLWVGAVLAVLAVLAVRAVRAAAQTWSGGGGA